MIWIILTIICVVAFIMVGCSEMYDKGNSMFALCWIGFISFCVGIGFMFAGITEYSYLKGLKEKGITLQDRIIDIKNARYESKSKGALVAGSIENIQQSQTLSNYIKQVAEVEAKYNQSLEKCKIYKTESIFWWFSDGAFISEKVLGMEKL